MTLLSKFKFDSLSIGINRYRDEKYIKIVVETSEWFDLQFIKGITGLKAAIYLVMQKVYTT